MSHVFDFILDASNIKQGEARFCRKRADRGAVEAVPLEDSRLDETGAPPGNSYDIVPSIIIISFIIIINSFIMLIVIIVLLGASVLVAARDVPRLFPACAGHSHLWCHLLHVQGTHFSYVSRAYP